MTPHEMADKRITLAEEYSRYSGEWVKCNIAQADFFNTEREKFKSDNTCQKAFDRSEKGVLMMTLKMKLKSIEKEMSALNTALRLAENEAKSLY
jgi:hypothetical protein